MGGSKNWRGPLFSVLPRVALLLGALRAQPREKNGRAAPPPPAPAPPQPPVHAPAPDEPGITSVTVTPSTPPTTIATTQATPLAMTSASTAVLSPPAIHAPSENWDDDFEFGAGHGHTPGQPTDRTHLSAGSAAGARGPRKRASAALSETEENWDDDYEDAAHDSQPGPSSRPHHAQRRSKGSTRENWDDEFAASPESQRHDNEGAFSSDDDDGAEFGLGSAHDEDRTVTSSTRNRPFSMAEAPPVPSIPSSRLSPTRPAPVPASPTVSSFSATLSYAPSNYSSTAHLALRQTQSAGSSAHGRSFLPQQPGVLRKPPPAASNNATRARRRLRKKSRPSRVGDDIFEMDDRTDDRAARLQRLAEHVSGMTSTDDDGEYDDEERDEMGYIPPVTPEPRSYHTQQTSSSSRPSSVAAHNASVVSFAATPSSSIPVPTATPSSNAGPSSPVRSPILSRLGSVKRWAKGARRLSTAPSDASATNSPSGYDLGDSGGHSRPLSLAYAQQQERARSPLGEPLNPNVHELQPLGTLHPKKSGSTLHQDESFASQKSGHKMWFFRQDNGGPLRNRKSRDRMKDPPGGNNSADLEHCPPNPVTGAHFPRRGSNAGLEDEKEKEKEKDHEAKERRGILGLRRISLIGGHKRTRSGVDEHMAPTPTTEPSAVLTGFSFPPPEQPAADPDLGPPIELSPPSPPSGSPRRKSKPLVGTQSEPVVQIDASPSTASVKFALASGAASLGRNGTPTQEAQRELALALRRNSLGDLKAMDGASTSGGLKIPARISRAQVGLKRDLGLVKEFASCIEQLRQLQVTYQALLGELRVALENAASPTSATSGSTRLFHLPRAPLARPPEEPARKLQNIEHEYSIWWECAEVLIELGGTGGPATSVSEPKNLSTSTLDERERDVTRSGKRRERAITLVGSEPPPTPTTNGPPQASPPPSHWRASTGRHDLSQRQLVLLKKMLNTPDPATFVVGGIVAVTKPTLTLRSAPPTGESSFSSSVGTGPPAASSSSGSRVGLGLEIPELDQRMLAGSPAPSQGPSSPQNKARRGSRGITSLRELLRSFKRQGQAGTSSSVSNATMSRTDLPPNGSATTSSASVSAHEEVPRPQSTARKPKARLSTGAQTVVSEQEARRKREVHPNSPYGTVGAVPTKSPRRPSLASLFRLAGGRPKIQRQASGTEARRSEDADYSDWDRMESASDLDLPNGIKDPAAPDTIRGSKTSKYAALQGTPPPTMRRQRSRSRSRTRGPSASRSSVNLALPPPSTPSPSKSNVLRGRLFRTRSRPGSRDGAPPPAPSQAFAHAFASANTATPTQDSENAARQREQQQQLGRERSATTPSRRPAGSRSVSANYIPQAPHTEPLPPLPDLKVALTPENLRPLLEYAREVTTRLSDCVVELRTVLGPRNVSTPDVGVGSAPT
ncbi:hypothetical protein AURDEDRAFT_186821 [Auricularia subglabra TFB-10046 SS5]|uniref:Uncharacterized protein n=1 Tax=Auricularia subglabra (strain TFB-10046 / SS5) TaxID=717982 RepID=J0LJR7_AURST|nr:hypothetical protein AURDEDRAFT_186821 [Auricularia subglabra TFB-10046 SS5]